METTEIRQNKNKLIPMLTLLTLALLGMTYYIYFSGKFDNNNTMKIIYVFLTSSMLYAIYIPTKKFIKNEPVLTFTSSEIQINEKGKSVSILWPQLIDWKIEKDNESGTHYLLVETADKTRRINIAWLDKSPFEIEELLTSITKN